MRDLEKWEQDFLEFAASRRLALSKTYPQALLDQWTADEKVLGKDAAAAAAAASAKGGAGAKAEGGGADAGNYAGVASALTANITPAALTITADNDTKVYGATKSYGALATAFFLECARLIE